MELVSTSKLRRIIKPLGIMFSIILLSACGGGGGGSGGGGNPSTTVVKSPVANAGADMVVNMFERVNLDPKVVVTNGTSAKLSAQGLELTGSSDNKEAIVKLVWSKIEGPDLAISSSGFNDGKLYFTAPSTKGANSLKISFRLTLTNAAGLSADDIVDIYVGRVNEAPLANAGDDNIALGGDTIRLRGRTSDADGSVVKFQWTQVSGPSVVLNDPSALESSFVAPIVYEETLLEFEFTVEDNEGKVSKDKVSVNVYPRDVPQVQLYFPPAKGIYTDGTISLFGKVSSPSSTITSLTVDAGNGPLTAPLSSDGSWRLDNVSLPVGANNISIVVAATDLEGRKGTARSQLQTSTNLSAGTGQGWNEVVGIDVDPSLNKLWMVTHDNTNVKLLSINLDNGDRSPTISDFSDAQEATTRAPGPIIFDGYHNRIYMSAGDSKDFPTSGQILLIDTVSGYRSVVADNARGVGPAFALPWGLALGNYETLYVADNKTDSILAVDLITGDRVTIADASTLDQGIDAPALLANSRFDDSKRLFMAPYANLAYLFELDLHTPTTSSLVFNGAQADTQAMGEVKGLAFNSSANTLYFNTFFEGLVSFNMSTNEKKQLVGPEVKSDALTFDETRGVLYMVKGFPAALYAVDSVSGSKVIISKPNTN